MTIPAINWCKLTFQTPDRTKLLQIKHELMGYDPHRDGKIEIVNLSFQQIIPLTDRLHGGHSQIAIENHRRRYWDSTTGALGSTFYFGGSDTLVYKFNAEGSMDAIIEALQTKYQGAKVTLKSEPNFNLMM